MEREKWPRSTMDSIRASEAPDAGSIPAEATKNTFGYKPIDIESLKYPDNNRFLKSPLAFS